MTKKVAISQSNYIPWKGYFDMIAAVDEFILFDEVQFTKNDWRNRNLIKTPQGVQWLTVPVGPNIKRCIREVKISNNKWQIKHWKTLVSNYGSASHFEEIAEWLEPLYIANSYTHLSEMNHQFIQTICCYLDISTRISNSIDYKLIGDKVERLVNLCTQVGGTEYISGPSARNYINENVFTDQTIKLTWFSYEGYPEYPQLWGKFTHQVTILDLLFNLGKSARNQMKYIHS